MCQQLLSAKLLPLPADSASCWWCFVTLRDTGMIRRGRNAQISMRRALFGDSCIKVGTGVFPRALGKEKAVNIRWDRHCQSISAPQLAGVRVPWCGCKTLVRLCSCTSRMGFRAALNEEQDPLAGTAPQPLWFGLSSVSGKSCPFLWGPWTGALQRRVLHS